MTRKDKIQQLLINYLLEVGRIELVLPDGINLEIGTLKENQHGSLEKTDDYCWVIATQKEREVSIDAYNLALKFKSGTGKMIIEDRAEDEMRVFSVI